MRPKLRLLTALAFWLAAASTPARAQSHAEVLARNGNISAPANRGRAVGEMQLIENDRRVAAWARADARRWPKRRILPNGRVQELVALDGTKPIYFTTHNANAAISTGANLLQAAPFSVTGSGFTVGEWDGGSARTTHQELAGRVTTKDGAAFVDHSTHVAGTIAAAGVQPAARGMAPAVRIDSYDFNSDKSEMTSRGASYPGEPGTIYLSNHSYGVISGWNYTGKASPVWDWYGAGTTSTGVEDDFGKYNTYSRDSDSLAASLPYYLIVRSAGNDRADNPAPGTPVTLTPNGTSVVSYDPALHPPGDGVYKGGGYDSMSFDAIAKNVLTVGAVADAVSGGARSPANGTMTYFSSWGPTDDGRIKPDVVANGDNLYSSVATGDAAYAYYSGTSMAGPNVTGSALLLVSFFDRLFPGQVMRASTLKALLIETADDLGTAGPDYINGWGLVNVKAAADLVQAYRDNPGTRRIVEDRVTTSRTSVTENFTWSGSGPIRVTLCWTDPAGTAATSSDSRTARLVNNLNLQLVGPGGSVHQPFVMPYVGDWSVAKLSAAATTGVNNTDNVEQVLIAAPSAAGVYQAQITFSGSLTNGTQPFSLIISGGAASDTAPAPALSAISPASTSGGPAILTLTSANVLLGATVKLTRSGQADIPASSIEVQGDTTKARLDSTGMAAGLWNVVVTNPDGQSVTLANAFSVIGALWQADLENGAAGWSHGTSQGTTDNWALVTSPRNPATHSWFAAGPAVTNVNELNSPAIAIPASATNLNLSFWHKYDFQSGRDGGVLEFSVDGGAWFDAAASGFGTAFATGGYNSAFSTTGNPNSRNPLAPRSAWSGANAGFTQVVVTLTDTVSTKYAGHSLRIRWRLATNSSTASAGWYLEDISINGGGGAVNLPPGIVTPAAASPAPVTGTTTALSVAASDDAGEAGLSYTWSVNDEFTAPIAFSENGTNTAKNTTATFSKAGLFTFTVTVRDGAGLTVTSSVDVQVDQTLTAVTLVPASATIGAGDTQAFTATALDQFTNALAAQPAFTWTASGGGAVSTAGIYTAGTVPGGPYTVTATTGARSANASITITGQTFTSWQTAHFTSTEITAGLAADTADFDADGLSNFLEYALGTDPRSRTPALTAAILPDSTSQDRLTLTFTRPRALPGVTYVVEVSGDLQTWDAISAPEIVSTATTDTITARDPVLASEAAKRFMRLRATRTAP